MKRLIAGALGLLGTTMVSPAFAGNANCEAPNVMILFDMSGSLGSKKTEGSAYNQAVSAVKNIVDKNADKIRYGLKIFPTPNSDADAKVYCTVDDNVEVAIGANNSSAISSYFTNVGGPTKYYDTPMWQALNKCKDMDSLKDSSRRNYVILITDGVQDCCNAGDYDDEKDCNAGAAFGSDNYYNKEEYNENRQDLINLVGELADMGIKTFVVGFGSKVDKEGLDGMAIAGGTAREGCQGGGKGDCYYSTESKENLQVALGTITEIATKEICDGLDNDCDGQVDEDLSETCEAYCGTAIKSGVKSCVNGSLSECVIETSAEICDGIDNDCDGEIDEGLTRACVTTCGQGTETCSNGVWSACVVPTSEEVCDGKDNDCDGFIDEDCACTPGDVQSCGLERGRCKAGIQRCNNDGSWGQCENSIGPIAEECNGNIDDDCDGYTDEDCKCTNGDTQPCGYNAVGICKLGQQICEQGTWGECIGVVLPENEDICDGLDNDCDGQVDEYCDCVNGTQIECGSNQGYCKKGVQTCVDGFWSNCQGEVKPKNELCNNIDDNCDGFTDNKAGCLDDSRCICGGCASPCNVDGSCPPGSGKCVDGYCVTDHCLAGYHCDGSQCIPGEDEPEVVAPVTPESGCSCNGATSPFNAIWLLLGACGLGLARRRQHN